MKTLDLKPVFLFIALLSCFACEPEEIEEPVADIDNQVVFWSDFEGPTIEVSVSGRERGTITAIGNTSPSCYSSGNVTVSLSPGTYSYSAMETSEPFRTWSGEFTIGNDTSCLTYLLHL